MTTPTVNPAKVKAFLAHLKEHVVEKGDEGDLPKHLQRCFVGLLRAEMLQRAVLVESEDPAVVLNQVVATAGKLLLEPDASWAPWPKPLIAGAAVIAARIAETLAHALAPLGTTTTTLVHPSSSSETTSSATVAAISLLPESCMNDMKSAMTRCEQVQEKRLAAILQVQSSLRSASAASSAPPWATTSTPEMASTAIPEAVRTWSYMAEGYYLRAASFQPEAPPMYKKAWDMVLERKQQLLQQQPTTTASSAGTHRPASWEAITALTQLHQLAVTKGNHKRAVELSLILAESWLDGINPDDSSPLPASSSSSSSSSLLLAVASAFVAPYRPITPGAPAEAAGQALDLLRRYHHHHHHQGSADEQWISQVLAWQALTIQEEAHLTALGQEEYQLALNRSADSSNSKRSQSNHKNSSGKTVITLSSTQAQVRPRYLAAVQLNENDHESMPLANLHACAVQVRDGLMQRPFSQHTAENNGSLPEDEMYFDGQACRLLVQYLTGRLKERARALAQTRHDMTGWFDLARFVQPLFMALAQQPPWMEETALIPSADGVEAQSYRQALEAAARNWSEPMMELVKAAATLVPALQWMCEVGQGPGGDNHLLAALSWSHHALFVLQCNERKSRAATDPSALSVQAKVVNKDRIRLEYASRAVEALLFLQKEEGQGDSRYLREQSDLILSNMAAKNDDDTAEYIAEFGTLFLEALVCWSGLHHPPWSFCTLPEARHITKQAQICIDRAGTINGRSVSEIEKILLLLIKGDAEGIAFSGGLSTEAKKSFSLALEIVESLQEKPSKMILSAKCLSGNATVLASAIRGLLNPQQEAEALAMKSLAILRDQGSISSHQGAFYFWRSQAATESSVRFLTSSCRQLVADIFLKKGEAHKAEEFLEAATQDAPEDAGAALALGAFRLRMIFFGGQRSSESDRAAQIQLMRAAKCDSTKASPFALLGYWYEFFNDLKRAVGCYSKALSLDPSHPVAGRGLLRLAPDTTKAVIERAIETQSGEVGWAWYELGMQKAYVNGADDLAVVSLLKAMRCSDIERPASDSLSFFYSNPLRSEPPGNKEMVCLLAEVARCYRRAGRFTAAIRSFQKAIELAGQSVSSSLLCDCANVELELGLFDDAATHFCDALSANDADTHMIAAYGQGVALLSIARRDFLDGKAGQAFTLLEKAIADCSNIEQRTICVNKLMGDIHAFGAMLPPDVFGRIEESSDTGVLFERQLSFVAQAEEFYHVAAQAASFVDEEEASALQASLIADLGINILSQAQLQSFWQGKGIYGLKSAEVDGLYGRAATEFQKAIEINPMCTSAWCGLGCAVAFKDPLLAQHSFCRSLELDNLLPDAYANLGFLYTLHQAYKASVSVSDALTQVADTPMMWINRALIMERSRHGVSSPGEAKDQEQVRQNIADAYRAALQVVTEPAALVGLALNCRVWGDDSHSTKHARATGGQESGMLLTEYLGLTGPADVPTNLFHGLVSMEVSADHTPTTGQTVLDHARRQVASTLDDLEECHRLTSDERNCLDTNYIRAQLVSSDSGEKNDLRDGDVFHELTLQRKIVHNPERGDLWLQLAKELAFNGASSPSSISGAAVAARKAGTMLTNQLIHTRTSSTAPAHYVDSEDLSDALALKFWLDSITGVRPDHLELQRALLIFPGNNLARQALAHLADS